nr:DUF4429 domain-containing protein [Streptomyces sp. MBT49]
MGDVLAGFHAAWEFESDSVLIRYQRGLRTPKLLSALGERRIPLAAIGRVTLSAGRRGTVVLRAEPRPGADPLMEAAAGQVQAGPGGPGPGGRRLRPGVRAGPRVAALRGAGAAGAGMAGTAAAPRRDPADIAERIRHLGELHVAGLVTDEEFSVKKAELLAEL